MSQCQTAAKEVTPDTRNCLEKPLCVSVFAFVSILIISLGKLIFIN